MLVDGADVRRSTPSLRHAIALVTDDPFLFSASVHENIAYARPDATPRGGRGGGAPRAGARLHRRAARGLRHADRRARPDALRRPAPAPGDRARAAGRPAHPDPRRRHVVGRRVDRAGDQGRAARGDARAHDVRDRPPPVDDLARRRDRRARGRPRGRARRPRRAARGVADLYREIVEKGLPDQVFLTRKPVEARRWPACERPARRARAESRRLRGHRRARAQAARPARAAAPYRWRVVAMFVGAAAGHRGGAGAAAAGQAGDRRRHHQGRPRHAQPGGRRVHCLCAGAVGRDLGPDLPGRLGRPARAAGPARAALRPPADAVDRLLLAPPRRRADLAADQRRAGARPAGHRRRRDAVPVVADADRDGRDPARARRQARAADVPGRSRCWRGEPGVPDRLRPTPTGSRARRSRGSPRTCRRRCRASAWCARSARSAGTSAASPSSTTRTATRT